MSSAAEEARDAHADTDDVSKRIPYYRRNVRNYMTSIPILLCCFCSGLVDSAVFNAWGVFATMQTGNTIILALGASHQPEGHPRAWLQALLAVSFFFFGALFHARYTRATGSPLRHLTLASSFLIQCALITTAAALVQSGVVPGIPAKENGSNNRAGMQSVTARQLGFNEIPTTVLTSCFCDLGNDPKLFAGITENWQRNRRIGSVISILLGGIIGGWLSRTSNGMPTSIWLAAAVKGSISVAWLLWQDEKPQESEK
ncbi:hypothetical protein, variant [Verruconis gallopava]|uniref:DUF1275 domain protein n=1 Tax=Verruconis gallopava TaxID=253628 RepID=A0A0D2AD65_9PEZI|nr:hypothetical protein, variant [Verruconis gallopava]KIW04390.1 hypothetical protein, variant [Verruconis gallopava]